jgi:hypothetical protein
MAVSAVLAPATTAGQSSTVVVTTASGPKSLSLFTAAGGNIPADVLIPIERLNSSATWSPTGLMLSGQSGSNLSPRTSILLNMPGSFRANRPVISVAVGVDVDDGT